MVNRLSGAASGLDSEAIITSLLTIKKQPITALETRVTEEEDQITQWTDLQTKLSDLQGISQKLTDYTTWAQMAAESSDTTKHTAAITAATMDAGTYDFVITTLAKSQSGYSNAQTSSTEDIMGANTATYTINGVDVTIAANSTLTDIKNAINDKTSSMTNGVKATILDNRLVLTNSETGTGHDMSITYKSGTKDVFTDIGLTNASGTLIHETAAQNLAGTLNGVPVDSATNKVTNFIEGATITFKDTGNSTLTISHDTETIKTLISDFVTSYNEAMKLAKAEGSVTLSDGGDLSSLGKLQGDTLLAKLQTNMRSIISSQTNSKDTYNSLYTVGVWFSSETNELSIDEDKLNNALNNNFEDVQELFRGWGITDSNGNKINEGIMRKFNDYAYSLVDPVQGSVTMRKTNLEADVAESNKKITNMTLDLKDYEDMLWEHFAAMEEAVSNIKSNATYFSAYSSSS